MTASNYDHLYVVPNASKMDGVSHNTSVCDQCRYQSCILDASKMSNERLSLSFAQTCLSSSAMRV